MKFLYCEGDEMLRHIQRDCECPLPGSIQGQAGWSFEQPGLVGAVPAYSRGLELGSHKGSFQTKSFCDSMLWREAGGETDLNSFDGGVLPALR